MPSEKKGNLNGFVALHTQATDLRESLQHYQRAMERESQSESAPASNFKVPELAKGEKIHVSVPRGKARSKQKSSGGGGGALLLKKPPPPADGKGAPLLKKPPPPADGAGVDTEAAEAKPVEKLTINMGDINLDKDGEENGDEGSDGAVFEGDEDQWKTEFDAK